jgi:tetratricopeptide (TPR) repeat protein
MNTIITPLKLTAIAIALLASVAADAAPTTAASKTGESAGLAAALLAAGHARATADTTSATDYYAKALALDPANTSLLQRSYSAAATGGKMDAAIAAAKKYYESEKEPLPLAGLLLATGHFQAKEYDQAWSYIDRIKSDSYLGFALPMIRAWAQAARNTPDAAVAELAPMQSTQGLGDIFHIMSGLLNENLGRKDDALIHYDALASTLDRQPLAVVRIIAAGYHRLGKSNAANEVVTKFNKGRGAGIGLYGINDSLMDAERFRKKVTPADGMAESFFAVSQLLSQSSGNGLADVAVAFGQMALYLNPDLPFGRWTIGSTLAARGRFDEANTMLSLIRKTDATYLAAQMQVVDNYEAQGKRGDSLARLQAVGKEFPTIAEVQMAMGNLLRRDEKFAESVLAYDKAQQLVTDASAESWSLYYGRGIALERTKQWARAENDFKRALQLNPDQPDVLNYLGYSWIDRGENLPEARRLIELAYSKSPENGFIVDSLGWAMYLAGDYKNATTYLEKAVELEPADATLNDHLGDAYWKVGRKTEARFQWRRALTLKPDEKQKATIQAKIEQGLARN